MDWEMPVMNGIQTLQHLKKDSLTMDIPVIMTTGSMTSVTDLQLALEAGAVDYLRKPVEVVELIARVNAALRLTKAYQTIKKNNERLQEVNVRLSNSEFQLKESNQIKDKLFSIIAHDLRTPIKLLRIVLNTNQTIEEVENIKDELASTERLLNNLLNWSLLQQNLITLQIRSVEVKPILENSLSLLSALIQQKQLQIESSLTVPTIVVDANILDFILRNVLSNAVKFTPINGKINIRTEKREHDILLTISDTGPGISQEKLTHLFNLQTDYVPQRTNRRCWHWFSTLPRVCSADAYGTLGRKSRRERNVFFSGYSC